MNPKWIALSEVLDEIQQEVSESKNLEKCLVVTQDDRTSQQLREVSSQGLGARESGVWVDTLALDLGVKCLNLQLSHLVRVATFLNLRMAM